MAKLTKEQIQTWLHNPVTQKFLSVIQDHKNANIESLHAYVLYNELDKLDLQKLSILKGQIFCLEMVLDNSILSELEGETKDEV